MALRQKLKKKGDIQLYKILIKYTPSSGKDRHMWISYGKTTVTTSGNKTVETFEEFATDDGNVLKEELIKLYETYGTSEVKVIDEIDVEHDIELIDTDEININTTNDVEVSEISTDILTVMDRNYICLNKNISELIADDIKVLENGSVVGTIHNITGFTDFSSKKTEQSGHYFPFRLTQTGTKMTIKTNGVAASGKTNMAFDPEIILRIPNNDTNFTIEVDGLQVVKLNFTDATLE